MWKKEQKWKKNPRNLSLQTTRTKHTGPLARPIIFKASCEEEWIETFTKIFNYQRQGGRQRFKNKILVRKQHKKATYFSKTFPLPRKHSKEQTYLQKSILLSIASGNLPGIVPVHQLKDVHPIVQNLFWNVRVSNFLLAGRLKYFVKNWLTSNPETL